MTRALLKQALEILELVGLRPDIQRGIREYLATPEPKPAAWVKKTDQSDIWFNDAPTNPNAYIPLYLHPSPDNIAAAKER
jgi:hypothetical protein